MLYYLAATIFPNTDLAQLTHYISFRIASALMTVLALSLLFGDKFITTSQKFFRSKAREHTPETHRAKDDMPTMGGLFVLIVVTLTTLLWCDLSHPEVWVLLGAILGFGVIGFWDDWSKIKYKKGISSAKKWWAQIGWTTVTVLFWLWSCQPSTELYVPFFKSYHPDLGYLFIPWAVFILVGTCNGVNFTDGLDGLAIGSLIPNFATFTTIAYLAGHIEFAHYLHIPFTGTSEIAIMGAILVGASLGFLWYNAYPAQIFMGDVGSLALGGGLALMALMTKQELLLIIAGGLFVVETLSIIAQVISFRYFGKRIFRMAPLHHHFELIGWPEAKITVRFGIISLILCLCALMTLKIR